MLVDDLLPQKNRSQNHLWPGILWQEWGNDRVCVGHTGYQLRLPTVDGRRSTDRSTRHAHQCQLLINARKLELSIFDLYGCGFEGEDCLPRILCVDQIPVDQDMHLPQRLDMAYCAMAFTPAPLAYSMGWAGLREGRKH